MHTFRLTPEGIAADYKKSFWMFIIFVVGGAAGGLLIASGGDFDELPLIWWVGILVAIIGLGTLRSWLQAKRRRSLLQAVQITVADVGLIYRGTTGIEYKVPKEKVKSVTLFANGKVKVRSHGNLPFTIPAFVERKEEFVAALEQFHPLERK